MSYNNQFYIHIPWPYYIKKEFINYKWQKMITRFTYNFSHILNTEKIPQSWNKSAAINIEKEKPDKELLSLKRGLLLTNTICNYLEM